MNLLQQNELTLRCVTICLYAIPFLNDMNCWKPSIGAAFQGMVVVLTWRGDSSYIAVMQYKTR